MQNKFKSAIAKELAYLVYFFIPDALEFVYFLHCPKSNKKASDPKNSLFYPFKSLIYRSAFELSCIPFSYFFLLSLRVRDLFFNEIGLRVAQTVLAHRLNCRK